MLIHEKTKRVLEAYIHRPSSSVILESSMHSGIDEITEILASKLLGKHHTSHTFTVDVTPKSNTIGVEAIRELKSMLLTKIGGDKVGRLAVIKHAEHMTVEAQNALLKLLEEPTDNTVIVLQAVSSQHLLATIRSRCQVIPILPISHDQALQFAEEQGYDTAQFNSAYLLSGGEAALFEDLMRGTTIDVIEDIQQAKSFLSYQTFERLAQQKRFNEQAEVVRLLSALVKICEAAMHAAKGKNTYAWASKLRTVKDCQQLLKVHVPHKLVFLKLCLEM